MDDKDLLDTLRSMLLDIAEEDPGPDGKPSPAAVEKMQQLVRLASDPDALRDLAAKLKD
jgi:hypothetical protein